MCLRIDNGNILLVYLFLFFKQLSLKVGPLGYSAVPGGDAWSFRASLRQSSEATLLRKNRFLGPRSCSGLLEILIEPLHILFAQLALGVGATALMGSDTQLAIGSPRLGGGPLGEPALVNNLTLACVAVLRGGVRHSLIIF